jgi:hypothetical protein
VRIGVSRQAEQLEALLDGRMSPDEAAPELRSLASLATRVQQEQPGASAQLTEDSRLSMRERLLVDIAELEAPASERVAAATRPRVRRAVTSAKAGLATGLASAMIGSAGVAMAAQEALPGDALYNLKKGTESVRMTLAGDSAQAGRLELRFAEERLEEVLAGIDRNSDHVLVVGLQEMDERSLSGAQRLVEIAERRGEDELLVEVDQFVERQSETLVEAFGRLPVQVRPYAEDSLGVLRQIRAELLAPVAAACDCEVTTAGEICDCGTQMVREVTSDPLPRPELDETLDDAATDDEARTGSDPSTQEATSPLGDATPSTDTTTSDSHELVPRLPGRLDDVGRTVNDTVGEVVDRTGDVVDRTGDTVDRVVEDTERTVRDTTDRVDETVDRTTDAVDDVVGNTTDAVENTVDGVGGLLNGD